VIEAGFQEIVITPPIGTTALAGYGGLKTFARGLNDDLLANCCVIKSNDDIVALVSIDVMGMLPETVARIRTLAHQLTNGTIPEENMLIACTHTHSGPDLMGIFYPGENLKSHVDTTYVDVFIRLVAGAILGAFNDLQPVSVKASRTTVSGLAGNRREAAQLPPNPVAPRTIDPEVEIVSFSSGDKIRGIIVNFAAHATSFPTTKAMAISADYIGAMRRELKKHLGDITCLYLNGACGDVNPDASRLIGTIPRLRIDLDVGERRAHIPGFSEFSSKAGLEPGMFASFYEEKIKKAQLSGFHEVECEIVLDDDGSLNLHFPDQMPKAEKFKNMLSWFFSSDLDDLAYIRCGTRLARAVLASLETSTSIDDSAAIVCLSKPVRVDIDDPDMANEGLFEEYMRNDDGGKYYAEVEVQVMKIGEIIIVTMPGEPVNQVQLRIKAIIRQQTSYEHVLFSEITNGEIGYILTPEEYDMMGYESIICFGRENAYILERALIELVSTEIGIGLEWTPSIALPDNTSFIGVKITDIIDVEMS